MNPYRLLGPRATAQTLAWIAARIPEAVWDNRADPRRFTPREVLAHLADWEPLFRDRMVAALDQDGVAVATFDEGDRCRTERYAEWDPAKSLAQFQEERTATLDWLEELTPEAMNQTFIHPSWGAVTIATAVEFLTAHDAYHLQQLTEAAV